MRTVLSFVIIAITASACTAAAPDAALRHNRIYLDPTGFLYGGLYGGYEFRIDKHHSLAAEAEYPFYSVQGGARQLAEAIYRYYYKPDRFWGIFIRDGFISATVPPTVRGDYTTYAIELSFLTIGANWGKVLLLKNRFPLVYRVGAGYPVRSVIVWKDGNVHPGGGFLEDVYRFTAALDSELSIGVVF